MKLVDFMDEKAAVFGLTLEQYLEEQDKYMPKDYMDELRRLIKENPDLELEEAPDRGNSGT